MRVVELVLCGLDADLVAKVGRDGGAELARHPSLEAGALECCVPLGAEVAGHSDGADRGREHVRGRGAHATAQQHLLGELREPEAHFLAGLNGNGVPNGWGEYGASGHSWQIVTDDAIPGSWLELSRAAAAGAASGGFQMDFTTGFAAGDEIYLGMRWDMIADDLSAGFRFVPSVQALTSANGVLAVGKASTFGLTGSGVISGRLVLPADTAKVRINLAVDGTPTIDSRVRVGQVTIVNRTAQGLT